MTDSLITALIAGVPPTVAAAGAFVLALSNRRRVKELHLSLNSRLDQLLSAVRAESFAAGVKSEVDKNAK